MADKNKNGPISLGELEGKLTRKGRSGAHITLNIDDVPVSIPFGFNNASFNSMRDIREGMAITAHITKNKGQFSAKDIRPIQM